MCRRAAPAGAVRVRGLTRHLNASISQAAGRRTVPPPPAARPTRCPACFSWATRHHLALLLPGPGLLWGQAMGMPYRLAERLAPFCAPPTCTLLPGAPSFVRFGEAPAGGWMLFAGVGELGTPCSQTKPRAPSPQIASGCVSSLAAPGAPGSHCQQCTLTLGGGCATSGWRRQRRPMRDPHSRCQQGRPHAAQPQRRCMACQPQVQHPERSEAAAGAPVTMMISTGKASRQACITGPPLLPLLLR